MSEGFHVHGAHDHVLEHAAETDQRLEQLLKKLEASGMQVEEANSVADKFDPQYLSKIVD